MRSSELQREACAGAGPPVDRIDCRSTHPSTGPGQGDAQPQAAPEKLDVSSGVKVTRVSERSCGFAEVKESVLQGKSDVY